MTAEAAPSRRGTTNGNVRGNSTTRRQRREWLIATYRADRDLHPKVAELLAEGVIVRKRSWMVDGVPLGEGVAAARCYRCALLLTVDTVTADRIKAGVHGGRYRTPRQDDREGVTNIRPACGDCNSSTGGALAGQRSWKKARR